MTDEPPDPTQESLVNHLGEGTTVAPPGPPDLLDLGAVFDALPSAYVVLRPDATIAAANTEFLRLVERRVEDVRGRPATEVFPVSLDGRAPLREIVQRVLATRRGEAAPMVRYDICRPGSREPVERWWSVTVAPLIGETGEVSSLVCRAEDVTAFVAARHDAARQDTAGDGPDQALQDTLFFRRQMDRAEQLAQAEASRRIARFSDMALRLAAAQDLEDLVRIVAGHGLTVLGSDGGGIAVPEAGGWRLLGSSAFTDSHRASWQVVPHDTALPICHSARTGERVLLPDAAASDAFSPVMAQVRAENGRRAWATLPLTVDGALLGGLAVAWTEDHAFGADELDLLDGCAAQCAQALERISSARVAQEEVRSVRRMAETLQRSLLSRPPVREGLHLAMRYQPAARGAEVGGDWFDAFGTRSGGTVLVVGDVAGHDQTAAATMGQIRNMVRGIAFDGDDRPANLLGRVDQAVQGLELDALATAVLAVVDAPTAGVAGRRLRWTNAGHLPPLLRRADGRVEVLDTEDDLLLGVDAASPRHEHAVDLLPGDLLALYTDGLVERRDSDLDEGIARVRRALERPDGATAAGWADRLLGTLRATGVEDDTALLVVQVDPGLDRPPAPRTDDDALDVVLPADPRSVREARRLTQRCCLRAGLDEDTTDTAVLLTSELVTNAIVHGRSDARLKVAASHRHVHVEVGDDNDRVPVVQTHDDEALSGRGISLLAVVASRWGITHADIGKVVWFTLDAGGPPARG